MTDRVVIAQVLWRLDIGGLERVVVDLINGLDPERFQSVLYCLEHEGELVDLVRGSCAHVVAFGKKPGLAYGLPFRMARVMRAHHVDIVHSHNSGPSLYGSVAGRLARVAGTVLTLHGPEASARRDHLRLQRWNLVDQMVAVSHHVRDVAVAESGMDPARVETIYNGVDVNAYAASQPPATEDSEVVGVVARLTHEKDHATLIEAFARIAPERPQAKLVIVGDGNLMGALVEQTRRLGIVGQVEFTGGRTDVPHLIGGFDVFVLPSRIEGLGITLLEAMAAELPTVATAVGGIPEIVRDNETGFLVPQGDSAAMASAIVRLLDDRALARSMGRRGRERVVGEFSVESMVRAYESLYRRLKSR